MARKKILKSAGKLVILDHDSKILADNPLGDPHVRKLAVWLPPGYDEGAVRGQERAARPPLSGAVRPRRLHRLGPRAPQLAAVRRERARARRAAHPRAEMGPCIIVFPDCFTCLGGNQYINSSAIGRYADYLTRELIPFVDREFRTLASRDHRGCFGKSSGGYGAIIHGMKYPQYWGAIGNHSGDAYFEFCYLTDWPRTLNELDRYRRPRRHAGERTCAKVPAAAARARRRPRQALPRRRVGQGKAERRRRPRADGDRDGRLLRPGPEGAARLPAAGRPRDRASCCPRAGRSGASTTPSTSSAATRGTCGRLRGIYIDCGWRDQYHLHFGARILSRQLAGARHHAHVRGVRRHALVDRLPDGREPAVPLPVAQALRSRATMRAIRSAVSAPVLRAVALRCCLADGARATPT